MGGHPHEPLAGRQVVVAVCGGIAAYKSALLVRELVRKGAAVRVVMTRAAGEFVGEMTFQALTGSAVFTELFDRGQEAEIGHIQVADRAELVIVAPATANTLARLSAGMADDPVAAVVLATRAPLLLAPSMNVNMWENPITQRNVDELVRLRGASLIGPGAGFLACRWIGPGRMAEPEDIVFAAERLLSTPDLRGRRVLITAGPTREAIDPVRFLSNRSTGRMGFALARAATLRGAKVELVSGPTSLIPAPGVALTPVTTAAEMCEAVMERRASADVAILSAAVADYRPTEVADHKRKKDAWGASPAIALERTTDILAALGATREGGRPLLVGFAAETGDPLAAARAKLAAKHCDLIVANDVSRSDIGFGSDDNEVVLVSGEGEERLARASKDAIAHGILSRIARMWGSGDE